MASKDIESLIKEFEDNHADWLDRMDADYDLYTLQDYVLDAESVNVTSNEPRVFADKIIQTCEAAELQVIVTTPESSDNKSVDLFGDKPPRNKEKENIVERLSYGLVSLADKRLRRNRITAGRTVQSAQWFYGAIRGSMVQRVLLIRNGNEVYPDILPVDPRYFSFGVDDNGMSWCAIKTWRDPEAIKNEYGIDVDDITQIVDFWDAEQNIVQIGEDTKADQIIQKHKLGRVPFVFVPVGSAPIMYSMDSKFENVASWGESIFPAGRGMYDVKNMVLSIWASLLKKSHKRSCFIITPAGKLALETVPWGTDKVVPLVPDSKIEWINPPDIAMTAPQFYNIIDREIQKADLATIEYGMVSGADYPSGKAVANLQEGRDSKITPLLKAASALWEDTLEFLCEQYEKKGTKITLKGYDSQGKLFYQDIKPADVKKPWDIEVKFTSTSPEKDMQNIAKAQILHGMGYAEEYINENVLQMQDPEKPIRQRRLQELEATNPFIKTLHQWEDAKKEGHTKEAQVLEKQVYEMMQQMLSTQQPQAQMEQPQPELSSIPEMPQMPQEQPQMPPEQIPPQGGMNGI